MPHFCIDYSPNLEDRMDMADFCNHLREVGLQTGVFPMPGIRVRAFAASHCSIADGEDNRAYIDISVRLRGGRTLEVRKAATEQIFEAASAYLAPLMKEMPLALSMEMRDIDPELSPKKNSIRQFLEGDQ
ncbi:5-carboxymethyl-2-hydroxymuconate Delta-isomerase [Cohaesibacter gelatinilyticus]|jgi:5-carboxymethyl-2-hydroxymuconate isomerase|uniref:5-carboxymethyl-2-hydroxymuconate isomerase n=1 Tax=Cohaesibacter gelatinilyticus TaxID=372072 RepID=A0A285PJD9_9HYPH|nr:5-carboxymethyl-2-hydroxymuconate Delta-isomerase [Cohaesibacter gelatinilyticus]SNZ21387.1 5-carboxymethyl-2-hydroxymuconate isomerase [Cohaesibacter gelatinilyticus]